MADKKVPALCGLKGVPELTNPVIISDVHLAANKPKTIMAFLRFMKNVAPRFAELVILGDLFDYWLGDDATPEPVTATIRQLREKFAGTTFPVTGDIVVSGRVTTSDYDENFYRTFCIEEDGAGIEVMAGIDHLHNDFPEGCQVTLRLRGLALGESHGVLQAGRMPAAGSGFATDYIGSKAALDAAVTRNGEALEPIAPTLLSPGELTPERCGTLVRIGALSYTPEDLTPGTWAGYKRFTDDTGAAVYTYVRSYARFADDEVPVGRCTLTGILQYDATGEGRYILKLRDENDWTR